MKSFDRESLQEYEGRISKIISRNVLERTQNKELAFENIYHLLKPGGEVGVVFNLNNFTDTWQKKLASTNRWKMCETSPLPAFFPGNMERNYYKNMLKRIGFRNVRSEREELPLRYNNGADFLEKQFRVRDMTFCEPPEELRGEFQRESRDLIWEEFGTGPTRFILHTIYLFAVKPSNS
ncbi:uncharacterized protein TNCV_4204041 [Trichonephila clavipes]|nr:uncharacterized protein TNCV_4204041 [Trichonephila clavipes]